MASGGWGRAMDGASARRNSLVFDNVAVPLPFWSTYFTGRWPNRKLPHECVCVLDCRSAHRLRSISPPRLLPFPIRVELLPLVVAAPRRYLAEASGCFWAVAASGAQQLAIGASLFFTILVEL